MPRRIPLLPFTVALIAGIVYEIFWSYGDLIGSMGAVVAIILILLKRYKASTAVLCFIIGIVAATLARPRFPESLYDNNNSQFIGTVTKVDDGNSGQIIRVRIDQAFDGEHKVDVSSAYATLNLAEFMTGLKPFDIICFKASLGITDYDPELPDDPDFTTFYLQNHIVATGFVRPTDLTIIGQDHSLKARFYNLRQECSALLFSSSIGYETYELLNALLLGDGDNLSQEEREIFTDAGLAHVLALSGTHVAIISSFIFLLLLPFRRLGLRTAVYFVVIILLWFYALLTGMSASVVRTVIMITILFIAKISDRRGNSLNALCFAAFAILLFDPYSLLSPSFQLSFSAVCCILLFTPFLSLRNIRYKRASWLTSSVAASVAALLGTALLAAYYFHKFPVFSVLSNVPAVFILPPLIVCGLLVLFFQAVGMPMPFIDKGADFLGDALYYSANWFASLPHACIENIYLDPLVFIPFAAFIILAAIALHIKSRFYGIVSSACLIATMLFIIPQQKKVDSPAYYLTGGSRSTEIVIETPDAAFLYSTNNFESPAVILERMNGRHKEFLVRRGWDSFIMDEGKSGKVIKKISLGNKDLFFASSAEDLEAMAVNDRPKLVFLTRSFRGADISSLEEIPNIEAVLLPKELHHNYVAKIIPALEEMRIPYKSLREEKLWSTIIP